MAANQELTDRTRYFFVAASTRHQHGFLDSRPVPVLLPRLL